MATQLAGVPYAQLPKAAGADVRSALDPSPRLVVIHDTSNDATKEQEARYAATRTDPSSRWTSAHFYVDTTGPLGSVPLNIRAWAAYAYANRYGIHLEMCGYNAGKPGAVPPKTIGITAGLTRQLCELFDIPMVKLSPAEVAAGKRGICGHWDITTGLGVGTHDDPGPKFDWSAFIAAVKGEDMPLTAQDRVDIWTHDVQDGPGNEPAYKALLRAANGADAAVRAIGALQVPSPAPIDPAAIEAAVADAIAANLPAIIDGVAAKLAAGQRASAAVLEQ